MDGLVDFYNLVFYFILFRLVSTRATLPLCTRAHMQAQKDVLELCPRYFDVFLQVL